MTISTINTSLPQVPALFKKISVPEDTAIINFGCGRYPYLVDKVVPNNVISYDPLFDTAKDKETYVITSFEELLKVASGSEVVMCANVLNVLTDELLEQTTGQLKLLHEKGCNIYIWIYEGIRSGRGGATTKGYQRNQRTKDYLQYINFGEVAVKGKLITTQEGEFTASCVEDKKDLK